MAIDDSPEAFKRLVKLYLWLTLVFVGSIVVEFAFGPWLEFSDAFDKLTATWFKPTISADAWGVSCGIAILAHYVGAFGLLRFKRWSRSLFVWPILLFSAFDVLLSGVPTYSTALQTFIIFIDSALFGAIVFLSYGKNQGENWFTSTINTGEV